MGMAVVLTSDIGGSLTSTFDGGNGFTVLHPVLNPILTPSAAVIVRGS
jgi:hypothetical protein